MNRPTGCPVPREASDSEKILKWLGYTQHEYQPLWVNPANCAYTRVITIDRERHFLRGDHPADPQLDYLVLEKVRTLDGAKQRAFSAQLDRIWWGREELGWKLSLQYLPGDYAEAAQFLWEGEPQQATRKPGVPSRAEMYQTLQERSIELQSKPKE